MVNIDMASVSSKGQIVIPASLRAGINRGDRLVVIRNGNQLILMKAERFGKSIEGDLIFAARTEKAWKDYLAGKFTSKSRDKFLGELERW